MKLLALLLAEGTVFAQGVDFLEQRMTLDVASSTVTLVEARATIRAIEATAEIWILEPPLPMDALEVNGSPALSSPHPSYPGLVRIVSLGETMEPGDELELVIRGSGALSCTSATPGALACVRNANETVLVPSSVDLAWYPINLFDLDPFVGTVEVRAPATFEVAAGQGAPIEDRIEGADRVSVFSISVPTELVSVYAANATRVESGPIVGLHRSGRTDRMQDAVDLGAELLPLYEDRFGDAPTDRTTIIAIPRGFPFGGLGLISTILIGDYVVGELDYLLEQGIAHELAHTWWGGLASSSDPAAAGFFGEAFAEYSARWALGKIQGESTRRSANRMNAVWYMYARTDGVDLPIIDANVRDSSAYVFVTYHKGSVVLSTLEAAVGEERFTTVLRDLLARGSGGIDVATLESALLDAGYDASADVDQWLRRAGYPEIRIERTLDGLVVDPGAYRLHLPLRTIGGGDDDIVVDVGPGPTIVSLDSDPLVIEADPEWTMVRAVAPSMPGDVSLDGRVDGIDLVEVALRVGTQMPTERRRDGSYDPLYDLNGDRRVDDLDLEQVR